MDTDEHRTSVVEQLVRVDRYVKVGSGPFEFSTYKLAKDEFYESHGTWPTHIFLPGRVFNLLNNVVVVQQFQRYGIIYTGHSDVMKIAKGNLGTFDNLELWTDILLRDDVYTPLKKAGVMLLASLRAA